MTIKLIYNLPPPLIIIFKSKVLHIKVGEKRLSYPSVSHPCFKKAMIKLWKTVMK